MKDALVKYILEWSNIVAAKNSLFYFDKAKHSEKFYAEVLSYIFGIHLTNLNHLKVNFEAIDLGDEEAKTAFQITSQYSKKKIDDTVDLFFKKNLQRTFKRLIVFFICDDVDRSGMNYQHEDVSIEVMTLHQLLHNAEALPNGKQRELLDLLISEFDVSPKRQREAFWRLRMKHQYPISLKVLDGDDTSSINSFFNNQIVKMSFEDRFREQMNNVLREMAHNVFKHGEPTKQEVVIDINQKQIVIWDWGTVRFNPHRYKTITPEKNRNWGAKYYQELMRMMRGLIHVKYEEGDDSRPNKTIFNFADLLQEVNPYEDCCIWEVELNNEELYKGCEYVYMMPESKKGPSLSRDKILDFIDNLKPPFKPGIAFFENDQDKVRGLKERYPGIAVKIVKNVKTPKGH